MFVACSAEEAADYGAIFGGAVGEFIVDEGGGQHAASGAARDEESETGREGAADFFVVAERDGDRRAVVDGG